MTPRFGAHWRAEYRLAALLLAALLLAALLLGSSSPALACFDPAHEHAYLVAPSGHDAAAGGPGAPWQHIERAQAAMRNGPVRRTFLAAGVYRLAHTLKLDHRDDGTSFVACPGTMPVIDGWSAGLQTLVEASQARDVSLIGLQFVGGSGPEGALHLSRSSGFRIERNLFREHEVAIVLSGSSGNTIAANIVEGSARSGIELKDGSDDNRLLDNLVEGTRTMATQGGAIFVHGASRTLIARNLVQNTRGAGIVVANWDDNTINLATVIAHNVVRNVNLTSTDSGAIYMLGRSHVDTQSCITANVVDGTGAGGAAHTIAIYLDDSTSGVTVESNRVRNVGTHAVEIHGGDDVVIRDNAFDLRVGSASAVLFQAAPADTNPTNTMRANVVWHNLVLLGGEAREVYSFLNGGAPLIAANVYLVMSGWAPVPALPDRAPIVVNPVRPELAANLVRQWVAPAAFDALGCARTR